MHALKEVVFVAAVMVLAYAIWQLMLFVRIPDTGDYGKPAVSTEDDPKFREMLGPTAWDVQYALEGRTDGIE